MVEALGRVPSLIASSPLFKSGGYARFNEIILPELHTALLREAWDQMPRGIREDVDTSDSEEWRGGCPARRFMTVPGGSQLDSLYHSEHIERFLQNLTSMRVCPSGQRGQYIFYGEPGDHISVHRDMEPCDVVMITCLYDNRPHESIGGTLYFYPNRQHEPLSHIRQHSEKDCLGIKLAMGETFILFGGCIPHGTIPIIPGQLRIVSTLCFQSHSYCELPY